METHVLYNFKSITLGMAIVQLLGKPDLVGPSLSIYFCDREHLDVVFEVLTSGNP